MYFGTQNASEVYSEEGYMHPNCKCSSNSFFQDSCYFLGATYPLLLLTLVGVFEMDAVKHMTRDMVTGVRKPSWELNGIFVFHFGIFSFEYLLKCEAFNVVSDSSHDGAEEKVTCKCGCICCFNSGWFWDPDFLWGR